MRARFAIGFAGGLLLFGLMSAGGQGAGDKAQQIAEHQRKAQEYLREKKPGLAIPELRAVAALDPGNVEVRANLGVLLFFEGKYGDAIPQLKAAVAAKPELWKIRSLLGMAERRTGDEQAGRADLEAAFPQVEDEKLKINVGRDLVESYAATEDLDKAAETVAALLKLEPANASLLYTSYRIHSEMTVAAMLALGLAAPDSAQTHQAMAHELQRERDLPGTIANLRKALALDSTLPGIHFELAEALHASDDQRLRAESEEQYRLAVEANPADAKAATRMGDLQVEKGKQDAAAGYYRRALSLQPGNEEANIGLAKVLTDKGDARAALPLLERVEAADPANALAHYRLSDVYRKLTRPEDVKRELELYKRYKEEREKLLLVYKQMRVAAHESDREK